MMLMKTDGDYQYHQEIPMARNNNNNNNNRRPFNAYAHGLRFVFYVVMWLALIMVLLCGFVGFWLNFFIYPFFYGGESGNNEYTTTFRHHLHQHDVAHKSVYEKPVELWDAARHRGVARPLGPVGDRDS